MPGVLFSTAFRFGNNPSKNGMDKIRLSGFVQLSTEDKLNSRSDILIRTTLFTPISQRFSRFHFPLLRFPELPMHPLNNTFRDSQRRIASLKPSFTVLPLDHSRFVGENTADCSFA
jgi:hypothetical protein